MLRGAGRVRGVGAGPVGGWGGVRSARLPRGPHLREVALALEERLGPGLRPSVTQLQGQPGGRCERGSRNGQREGRDTPVNVIENERSRWSTLLIPNLRTLEAGRAL